MKAVLKVIFTLVAFLVASGATYVVIRKWNTVEQVNSGQHRGDTLEGVLGLSEGEIVTLPTLKTLNQENIDLGNLKEEHLLCVFIGSKCSRCSLDGDLWKDLNEEAGKRGVAFYLINVGDELEDLEKFSSAYNLDKLPLLFDPTNKVGPQLKVGFLPQYILFTRDGQVVHRWDGLRRYDKKVGAEQLARFFRPH